MARRKRPSKLGRIKEPDLTRRRRQHARQRLKPTGQHHDYFSALLGRLRAGGVRAISPNGVLGDPAGASADEGHELLRAASEELVAMVDARDRGA